MAKWVVFDSLSSREQWFCSHLSAYSHYLREAGEDAVARCLNMAGLGEGWPSSGWFPEVVFALDGYDYCWRIPARVHIAQVAAITNPLPWDVRKEDGSPAYSLVISSIPAMVERARAAGFRAEYQPLAFDLRARACMMGVKREKKCIFIGTTGPNHQSRTELLRELSDVVEVLPPVYGREYFRALAGATAVLNIHAEWSEGVANNMRLYEASGMGCDVVSDGEHAEHLAWEWWRPIRHNIRRQISEATYGGDPATFHVLEHETYESRIPQLIEWADELLEAKR